MPFIQRTRTKTPAMRSPMRSERAFTVVELLVVIGIILVLLGILLPALSGVINQSRRTATTAIMEDFGKATDAFYLDFGFYPGAVPGDILAQDPTQLSGTENVLLHLMGGVIRREDFPNSAAGDAAWASFDENWTEMEFDYGAAEPYLIKVNLRKLGEGPLINGTQYEPKFTPRSDDVAVVRGQWVGDGAVSPTPLDPNAIPDLIDAWGQPIIYMASLGGTGELVGNIGSGNPVPQFTREHIRAYIESDELGELRENQAELSIFNIGSADDKRALLAQALRHPSIGDPTMPLTQGQPRGRWAMFSAGKDGIYFSVEDGPGSKSNPIDTADDILEHNKGPEILDRFDDLRAYGGGGG